MHTPDPNTRPVAAAEAVETAPAGPGSPLEGGGRISREGLAWVAATLCLFVTGLFKAINLLLLLAYLLTALLAANAVLARRNLRAVRARRLSAGPVFAGEPAAWLVEVVNDGARAARGWTVEDAGPEHARAWFVVRLDPGRSSVLRTTVSVAQRGRYRYGPLRAWSSYPFGLLHHAAELAPAGTAVILPRLGTVHAVRLRHWLAHHAAGDGGGRRRLCHLAAQEADVYGLRPFRPGDSPRWIHWKTSARRSEWMVREFEDSAPPHLVLVAEPWLEPQATPAGRERLEAAISLAGSVCREWCREPTARITLVVAGPAPSVLDGPSRPDHALRLLAALALEDGGSPAEPAGWLPQVRRSGAVFLVVSSRPGRALADRLSATMGRAVASVTPDHHLPWYNAPAPSGEPCP